jgi:hypothetical protein
MKATFSRCTVLVAVLTACSSKGEQDGSQVAQEVQSALGSTGDGDADQAAPVDDPALHRTYGVADMRMHECMKVQPDGSVLGDNCPSAFVMFGPYLTSPPNADLKLTFDIESSSKLVVTSDVVSSLAKNFHGAMDDQEIAPRQARRIGYRIHFSRPAEGVEARLWVRGDGPSSFQISNFSLEVR